MPVHTEAYPLPQQADLSPSPTPSPTPNSALTTTTTTTTSLRPAPYDPPEQAGHSALPEHRHFFSGITPDVRERLQARAARGHASEEPPRGEAQLSFSLNPTTVHKCLASNERPCAGLGQWGRRSLRRYELAPQAHLMQRCVPRLELAPTLPRAPTRVPPAP